MKASMQKLIAMGLCVVLAVGSLTGCGGSSNDAGSASGDGAKTSSSSDKKTFSDLGGMDITVGDWFTSKDTLANRTDEFGKKQNEYWKSIQEKYNFKITRDSVYSYTDAKSDYVNDVMASSPKYELYYLYQEFVSEPLMKGLMYDLSTLPEFNFDEEKWNPTVKELMSIGDGKTDQYAMASFSKYYLPMCAANNNATFVSRDKDGKYVDAITSKEFKDAMNWGVDLIKKGYIKPKPSEDVAWDWYKAAFRDGEAAMQTAEVYEISAFADMEDDWGFVMFPYNQEQKDATNKTVPNDNIVVMPSCFDQEKAEKIAFAYDLYTEPVEGYTPHDQILEQYYPQFRDDRAVDETIGMMLEEKHKSTSYLPMISEIDYGDFCYPVYANATTPAKKIEELSTKWDTKISKVNAEYDKFAKEHTK